MVKALSFSRITSAWFFLAGALLCSGVGGFSRAGLAGVTEREIVRVRSEYFLARQELSSAEAVLRAHLAEDPKDPDARARLAEVLVIHLRPSEALGELDQAFALVDSRNWTTPERVKWTSLKAQILWSLKKRVEASHALKALEIHSEYAEWLAEIRAKMASGNLSLEEWPIAQPSSTLWDLQAQLNVGQDSNFGFVSDPIATSLQTEGSADLSSLYSDVALSVARIRRNAERSEQYRFGLGYRQYVTEEARYYNSLTPALSYQYAKLPQDPFMDWVWQHGAQIQTSLLNLNGMQLYLLGIDWRPGLRRVSGLSSGMNLRAVLQYNAYGSDYAGDGSENRSGPNAGAEVSWDRRWDSVALSGGAQLLKLQPSGSSYQGYAWMTPLLLNWGAGLDSWTVEFATNPGQRVYSGGTESRRDLWLDGRVSFHWGWGEKTRWGVDGVWTKNNSNQDDYDFTKTEASVFIRHQL